MDSHRVGSGRVGSRFSWAGSCRVLKFGPACNSEHNACRRVRGKSKGKCQVGNIGGNIRGMSETIMEQHSDWCTHSPLCVVFTFSTASKELATGQGPVP